MAFIYKLTFMNGKSYIGQTSESVRRRYRAHSYAAKGGSCFPVHKAWRALGEPSVCIIAECDIACVSAVEIDAIQYHKTLLPDGYNMLVGGESSPMLDKEIATRVANKKRGTKHSEESKKKMSIAQTGRRHTTETKNKLSVLNKGKVVKPASKETKEKMSESQFKRWLDPEHRARMSLAHLGTKRGPLSDEVKARMSAARKGKMSPEGEAKRKAAQIAAVKGKKLPEELRLRLSEIRKLWWANKRSATPNVNR